MLFDCLKIWYTERWHKGTKFGSRSQDAENKYGDRITIERQIVV